MSHTPGGGHPQGWENKLADRSSLPPVPGEERGRAPAFYPEVSNFNFYKYGSKGSSSGRKSGGVSNAGYRDVPSGSRSPPAYLRWAHNLRDLLEDAEGVRLFQGFVNEAGQPHADRLKFYFACQGLKQQKDPSRFKSLVAAIYRFLKKSQLTIPEDVRRRIKHSFKDEESIDIDIFDSLQAEVEKLIKETTYVSFLRSDTYLKHANDSQHSNTSSTQSSGSISSSSSSRELCGAILPNTLATLHEGEELSSNVQHQQIPIPHRLTKDSLMASQNRRLQNETFSGSTFGKNSSVYSYPHLSYGGYCPTSKQDSELQSMSSGRTDSDALSMSGSSVDGMKVCHTNHSARREHSRHLRAIMESAALNKDIRTHDMIITRIDILQKSQCARMEPEVFAPLLIEKLEKLKREQSNIEKLDRKLMDVEGEGPNQPILAGMVAAALREKLQLDDDNDQDILDQHVSRVWSDLTPARSPGRPISPPHPHVHSRRYRDTHSTLSTQSAFSADSGNVRDYCDTLGSERASNSVSKSRSVPDYNDPYLRQSLGRRSISRKTLTDLSDSGVSVFSDTPPVHPSGMMMHQQNSRVLMRIDDKHKDVMNKDRYGRKSFSRSGSVERPGQPIASDSQMPPMTLPHTPTQLDEVRRRLMHEQHQSLQPQRGSNAINSRHTKRSGQISGKMMPPPIPSTSDASVTVAFVTFPDEPLPYRLKIPAAFVTLKQFKDFLPKKGNYRYFFKTECEELKNKPIQEEINNDNELLPLWEGKIMAKVKHIE